MIQIMKVFGSECSFFDVEFEDQLFESGGKRNSDGQTRKGDSKQRQSRTTYGTVEC